MPPGCLRSGSLLNQPLHRAECPNVARTRDRKQENAGLGPEQDLDAGIAQRIMPQSLSLMARSGLELTTMDASRLHAYQTRMQHLLLQPHG